MFSFRMFLVGQGKTRKRKANGDGKELIYTLKSHLTCWCRMSSRLMDSIIRRAISPVLVIIVKCRPQEPELKRQRVNSKAPSARVELCKFGTHGVYQKVVFVRPERCLSESH